ncbi:MAG: hypothetical protein KGZ39_06320 [Simkania sp.]|nr:hypothetical protein [Simkania sp.]
MEVSKSLKVQVLLDVQEIRALLDALGPIQMFLVSQVVGKDYGRISKEQFLQRYASYVEGLKEGIFPEESVLRPYFSSIWTATEDVLYAMPVKEAGFLIKATRPVVQLQLHHLSYSEVDGKFHSMVQGKESITWGIQFSYPQIFQHPRTKEFRKITQDEDFPNTALFLEISRWMRQNTLPTPLLAKQSKVNLSVRLGKQCFSWIHRHPRLVEKQFQVVQYDH